MDLSLVRIVRTELMKFMELHVVNDTADSWQIQFSKSWIKYVVQ